MSIQGGHVGIGCEAIILNPGSCVVETHMVCIASMAALTLHYGLGMQTRLFTHGENFWATPSVRDDRDPPIPPRAPVRLCYLACEHFFHGLCPCLHPLPVTPVGKRAIDSACHFRRAFVAKCPKNGGSNGSRAWSLQNFFYCLGLGPWQGK